MGIEVIRSDGTPQLLVDLIDKTNVLVECTFGTRLAGNIDPAVDVWFMNLGCAALNSQSAAYRESRLLNGFSVQALCYHHSMSQEPLFAGSRNYQAPDPRFYAGGSHLLLELIPLDPESVEPALRLPYSKEDLQRFATQTELGKLVFQHHAQLLEA